MSELVIAILILVAVGAIVMARRAVRRRQAQKVHPAPSARREETRKVRLPRGRHRADKNPQPGLQNSHYRPATNGGSAASEPNSWEPYSGPVPPVQPPHDRESWRDAQTDVFAPTDEQPYPGADVHRSRDDYDQNGGRSRY